MLTRMLTRDIRVVVPRGTFDCTGGCGRKLFQDGPCINCRAAEERTARIMKRVEEHSRTELDIAQEARAQRDAARAAIVKAAKELVHGNNRIHINSILKDLRALLAAEENANEKFANAVRAA